MQTKQIFTRILVFAALMALGTAAHATIWNIDAVMDGTGVAGYGASSFHRATDASPMSGTDLGTITKTIGTGFFGTWDDVTGVFDGTFNLSGNASGTVDVNGNLLFGATWLADPFHTLSVAFSGTDLWGGGNNGLLYFKGLAPVCCNATNAPNSIESDGFGGKIITLWGANGFDEQGETYAGGNGDTDLGMDLRVHLVKVPEPTSMMLMGLGLLGLGFKRRALSI